MIRRILVEAPDSQFDSRGSMRENPCSRPRRSLLIGNSDRMKALRDRIETLAATDPQVTILIWGPSGAGKELVAKEIHARNAATSAGQFVAVDLSYVPRELAGSRLFGHAKGAFTGANERRSGAFETGSGGTVFLDEVSSISLEFQGMFLRVLQEREFSPLGSTRVHTTNARIIAASNENLWKKVQRGLFRQDLYFRLQVLQIAVPSLEARSSDIPELAGHFIRRHGPKVGCAAEMNVDPRFYVALQARKWPGNVRQLENTIIQCLALAAGSDTLTLKHLASEGPEVDAGMGFETRSLYELPYSEAQKLSLHQFKRAYWSHKLELANGNVAAAARMGDVIPSSLYRMLKDIGVREDLPDTSDEAAG
jgi:DNA-binding NtrC family response regulator